MKYIVIVGDGMADRPLAELGGKTPLEAAHTPNMDLLAKKGFPGRARTVPEGMHPGSDVANLSILGYDPNRYYSGRAPLEAASIGVELKDGDVAFRCNLVTLKFNKDKNRAIMEDYSSGHITSEEAKALIGDVAVQLGSEAIRFYPGVSYRHLMVWSGGAAETECIPPHDITGKEILDYLPVGPGEDVLRDLMIRSVNILEAHPVNRERVKNGRNPGNSVWFWGQGKKPAMPTFREKYGIEGALISAVDLTKGLGIYAGFDVLKVPGITGYIDTNYRGKADAALEALRTVDFVYVHVEAPDEAGHMGKLNEKIQAIEDFDRLVVGPIMEGAPGLGDYRILVLPDHPTPIELKTHSADPVPFVLFDSGKTHESGVAGFSERFLEDKDILVFDQGHLLMDHLIQGK